MAPLDFKRTLACATLLCGLACPPAMAMDAAPMLQFELRFGGPAPAPLQLTVRAESLGSAASAGTAEVVAGDRDELWQNGNPRLAPYVMPPPFFQVQWAATDRSRIRYLWNLPGTAGEHELDLSTPLPEVGTCGEDP